MSTSYLKPHFTFSVRGKACGGGGKESHTLFFQSIFLPKRRAIFDSHRGQILYKTEKN
ncbi:unnamed protein product, partial [Gulo gulo]